MMFRGPQIALLLCLFIAAAMLIYIGPRYLPQVVTEFWSVLLLGASLGIALVLLVWTATFSHYARQYGVKYRERLSDERRKLEEFKRDNDAILALAEKKEQRGEALIKAAQQHQEKADAKVKDAERRRVNAMGAARRRQKKLNRIETRH